MGAGGGGGRRSPWSDPNSPPGTPEPVPGVRVPEAETELVPDWEGVARTYGRFLYTIAYRLTGDPDDAQDLVQETLLRVRRGLRTYRPGSMEGWLSRIVTNAFLDDVRRRRRRPVSSLGDAPEGAFGTAPAADEAMAADALPSDVEQALLQVPEEFRVAVVLCDVVGLSYQQIGDALGVPVGTVRSRIHRGRALLREALS